MLKSVCNRCDQAMSRMYVRIGRMGGPFFKLSDHAKYCENLRRSTRISIPGFSSPLIRNRALTDKRKFRPIGWYCSECIRIVLEVKILRIHTNEEIYNGDGRIIEQTECHYKVGEAQHQGCYRIYRRSKENSRSFKPFANYCTDCGMFITDRQRDRRRNMERKEMISIMKSSGIGYDRILEDYKAKILPLAEQMKKEKVVPVGSICTHIIHSLKTEIKEGLISPEIIFEALPEEYKNEGEAPPFLKDEGYIK